MKNTLCAVTAKKIAAAVPLKLARLGYESSAVIETGIDLSSNTNAARVVSADGKIILNWISATGDTVRESMKLVRDRIDQMNDEYDAKK